MMGGMCGRFRMREGKMDWGKKSSNEGAIGGTKREKVEQR